MNILPKLSRNFIFLLIVLSIPVFFILKDFFEAEINEYLFDTYTLKSIKHISETDPPKLDSLLNDNANVVIYLQDINSLRYNKEPLIVPLSAFDFNEKFDFLVVEKFLFTSNKILSFVHKKALQSLDFSISYSKDIGFKHLNSFGYSKDVRLLLSFDKEELKSHYISIDFFKFTMDIHKKYFSHTSKIYKEILSNSKIIEKQFINIIVESFRKKYYQPSYNKTLTHLVYLNKLKNSSRSDYLNSLLGNIFKVVNIEEHIELLKEHHYKYSGENRKRLVNQFLINNMEEVKYAGFCYIKIISKPNIYDSILGKFTIEFDKIFSKFIFKPYHCNEIQNITVDNLSDIDNFTPAFQQTIDAKILEKNYIHNYKNLNSYYFGTVL